MPIKHFQSNFIIFLKKQQIITIQEPNLNMHLTMKHIWVWSEKFSKKPSNASSPNTQIINHFLRPFVEWNHKPKTEDLLLWKQTCSTVDESWVLSIISWIKLSWKSDKKSVCACEKVCKPVDPRATEISNCSVRPDIILNLHFWKAIKNYNSNSPQTIF